MIRNLSVVCIGMLCLSHWVLAEPQKPASGASSKSASPTLTITDQDNGKDIDLTAGEQLIVKLNSNPSTGYSWAVAGDPSPLKLQKTTFHKNTKSSQAVGAPGVQVLQLSANSAGMATLTVVYRRSWEYNVPPVKTFSVRVNVR